MKRENEAVMKEKPKRQGNLRRAKNKIVEFVIITTYITSIGCTLISVYRVHTSFFTYIYWIKGICYES